MGQEEAVGQTPGTGRPGGTELLATPIIELEETRVVVFLAAQPDPERPGEYVLDATAVPEAPVARPMHLSLTWPGGRRAARLNRAGSARLRGIPAHIVHALRDGDPEALQLQIKLMARRPDARGGHGDPEG
jgi:hypothetical protein